MDSKINFVEAQLAGDYASEVASTAGSSCSRDPLSLKSFGKKRSLPPPRASLEPVVRWPGVSGLTGLDAYSRHKKFINDYVLTYGKERVARYVKPTTVGKTDVDVLRENHRYAAKRREKNSDFTKAMSCRFIRSDSDNELATWEARMSKKYYDKLFKEYCIADLSDYRSGKIGLRWRTQQEVFDGHGQFRCGSQNCVATEDLQSFEMNFSYKEDGERKNALVKLRVCPDCAIKVNYRKLKRQEKERKQESKRAKKRKRSSKSAPDSSNQSDSSDSEMQHRAAALEPDGEITIGEWKSMTSKSTGKKYWYNTETGATQWERPALPSGDAASAESSGEGEDRDQEAEDDADRGGGGGSAERTSAIAGGNEIWASKPKESQEAVEDEHEEYFQGLFM